ncbi:receptor-type tyrosine-protein phosphatase C [Lampris incognitus]|uniref:receptor-type tyrosine-protein phosphatase C n=1 Tax=Lampris incognitus TaxID=2546036 RepID=UPI0024B48B95|nr:receptor-type tyrosine-protein phosphatase C [Lampris incognitus]
MGNMSKDNNASISEKRPSTSNSTQEPTKPTITQYTTMPPNTTQGSFNVTPIQFGLRLTITAEGKYNLSFSGTGQPNRTITVSILKSENYTKDITDLKPCTVYDLKITHHHDTQVRYQGQLNTLPIRENEVERVILDTERLCYRSKWDITAVLREQNYTLADNGNNYTNVFCTKPRYDDICSDLTTAFTLPSQNCTRVTVKQSVVELLDPNDIKLKLPAEVGGKILWTNIPICEDRLSINYTCQTSDPDRIHEPLGLQELEFFTNYGCTGEISYNNSIIKNKTDIQFRTNCDVNITFGKESANNTSIELPWNITNSSCLKDLAATHNLSYSCNCDSTAKKSRSVKFSYSDNPRDQKCTIEKLEVYTTHRCKVNLLYKDCLISTQEKPGDIKTKPGVPDAVEIRKVILPQNNVIVITCKPPKKFNGPLKTVKAVLTSEGRGSVKNCTEDVCNFEFIDLSYSTKYNFEVTAYNGHYSSIPTIKSIDTYYNDKALIGFLVFAIISTSMALFLVLYKIYIIQRRKSHNLDEHMELISSANEEENLLNIEPITAEVLLDAYKRKIADEARLFLAEFQSIPRIFSRILVKEAKKSYNSSKNRYVDILPYDHNRVQLTTGNGELGCDYINASFIDGFKESKKYIAAQGPKEETIGDFWRMIWEQQSAIIVMVTRCEEGNRVKCAQYWPSPEQEVDIFEEFVVKLKGEDHCPDYIIRHLSITNKRDKNTEREVTHIQFISWPDHGVPEEPHLLLKLRRRVNAFNNFFSGPIVIHCSAGVGRTGTYIGIDAMIEGLEAEGRVDIYGYVVKLRRQRCLMVQVEAQYILIHQALIEHNQFGETETSLSELHSMLGMLKMRNSSSDSTLLEDEFQRVPKYKNWRTFNAGLSEENRKKNRLSNVLPYDYNRVLLRLDSEVSHDGDGDDDDDDDDDGESSDEEDERSTKYINASHIDGYWRPRNIIATQAPLPDTIADFWQMVFQNKARTVIMLSDSGESDLESAYFGNERKNFGDIEVAVTATDNSPTFTTRVMQIRHAKRKESRQVKHFSFLKWVNTELPERAQDLVDMIKNIKQTCGYGKSKSERTTPIVVQCSDGSTHCGVFCALWNLLDAAETEKLVDVFQVVKSLRKERPAMISSLEQYQFLYDALEGAFPVQNGDVKAASDTASAGDSVQMINETNAAEAAAENQALQSASDNQGADAKEAAESTPLVGHMGNEDKQEQPDKVSSSQAEKAPPQESRSAHAATPEM